MNRLFAGFERVIVAPDPVVTETAGGLLLPNAPRVPLWGTLVANDDSSDKDPSPVERVLYPFGAGIEFKLDDKTYVSLKQDEILAVVSITEDDE